MDKLLARLSHYVDLTDDEAALLRDLPRRSISVARGKDIISEGDPTSEAFIVRRGWAIRYTILRDGRRQILNVLLPGDIFDLQVLVAKKADHNVTTITACDLFVITPRDFASLFYRSGSLGLSFWWAAVQEEAILREQIVRNGRRSGEERLCHFLLELYRRSAVVGEGGEGWFHLPLTQTEIADALGLTTVYTNRLLRQLRQRGLIEKCDQTFDLKDVDGLKALCDFDGSYLFLKDTKKLPTKALASLVSRSTTNKES